MLTIAIHNVSEATMAQLQKHARASGRTLEEHVNHLVQVVKELKRKDKPAGDADERRR